MIDLSKIRQIVGVGEVACINHGNWSVCVDSHGAHVLGLFFKEKNILHYSARDIAHSGIPICLPNFGPLSNGVFQYQGTEFPIPQHGFFRDCSFQLIDKSCSSLSYQLNSSNETRQLFPFDFCFTVTFSLHDSGLKCVFSLTNNSKVCMPIAPGIHPYYTAATGDDVIFETRSDEANDNHQLYLAVRLEDSLKSLVEDNSGVRKFRVVGNPDLHLKGHGLETTQLKIGSNQPLRITADLESFNRMTLWRKHADSTFICLEPAYVKNGLNGQPISIPSGEIWSTVFKISH